ncbi:MAG: DinB family protein [Acidobacteria bacterium]|nr:DinB family protein [Acidobacteriota bacterium]
MAGAAERLGTYLMDEPLSPAQLEALKREAEPGASAGQLLAEWEARVQRLERYVRAIDPEALRLERRVGRLGLPTTVIGLIVRISEHSQRHLGQAITTLKLVRAMRNGG